MVPIILRFTAFGTAAGLGVLYLAVITWPRRSHLHIPPQNAPAVLRLLVHYWPGSVVLVAVTLEMGLGVTTVFLTRFFWARR
jgi:hypothetical protein